MNFALIYLIVMFIISAVNVVIFSFVFKKQKNNFIFYIFLCILATNLGHLLIGLSSSLEEVIIANKLNYIGASFIPMFMFFAMLHICHYKINMGVQLCLIALNFTVCVLAMTVGNTNWYYSSIEFYTQYGIGTYRAEYGWGHNLLNFMLIFYVVADFIAIAYAAYRRSIVSLKNIAAMTTIGITSISSLFISRFLENDTLVMPLVYVLDQLILMYICANIKWYDISTLILETLEGNNNSNAYISFVNKGLYMGCNKVAQDMFPELSKFRIDAPLPAKSNLSSIFYPMINSLRKTSKSIQKEFSYFDRHYKSFAKILRVWPSKNLYLFRIQDDSNTWLHIDKLKHDNELLKTTISTHYHNMQSMQEQIMIAISNIVESRDNNTGGHLKRTSNIVKILATKLKQSNTFGLDNKFLDNVILAAPMHDIGKIAISDEILKKTGRYTNEEFEEMKTHALKGASIVTNLLIGIRDNEFITIAKNIAHYHHERWTGKGYPEGLIGLNIPFEARIMAIADVYDALVSKRSYKEIVTFPEAERIIIDGMGTLFDPNLKETFMSCINELRNYYIRISNE